MDDPLRREGRADTRETRARMQTLQLGGSDARDKVD